MKYELLDHTADLKIRVFGKSFLDLLSNAAYAISELILPGKKDLDESYELSIEGDSKDQILVRFLNELIFIVQTKLLVFKYFEIMQNKSNSINIKCKGIRIKPSDTPVYDIKGVTYHDLSIIRDGDIFRAEIVVDV